MTDLTHCAATELAVMLQTRLVSAVEVLAEHCACVARREPEVNAFVTLDWDAAEKRATELDAMAAKGVFAGPLHGVPIGIKDIFETKGLRTTWGSKSFEHFTPDYDALHVRRLREAGAVIIGKTNTPEFAFSGQTANLVSGTTRNPLNLAKSVAGSSGGAAAALAAHMVALADGSDLGGSARTPAAWCGVVGYRPTSGLIPYAPNPAPFDGLSIPCPMARNVTDLTFMTLIMQGNSGNQPLGFWKEFPSMDRLSDPPKQGAGRVALLLAPFGANVEPTVQAAIAPVEGLCRELGWQVVDSAPDLPPLLEHGDVIRGRSALQVRAALKPDMSLAGEAYRTACAQAKDLGIVDFISYEATRARVWAHVVEFFAQYDFALWPTATGTPFSADLKDGEITEDWRTVTLTPPMELPSISIPCGTSGDGMPVGLHITGPKGSDANLLRFARSLERELF